MFTTWIWTLASVFLVSLASLAGIFTLGLKVEKLKQFLFVIVAFSVGTMLGDVFIHLLPEVIEEAGFTLQVSISVLFGVILFFILEKFIHWHHCHSPHTDKHDHHPHPFAITNLVGDAFHNFIDGMLVASSYLVSVPVGIATTLAVLIHEIPQEIGDFGILLHGGFTKSKALLFNFLSGLLAVVGAIVALLLGEMIEGFSIYMTAVTAGIFLYVAGSDLIPELHKEVKTKKSLLQLVAIIFGILLMSSLLLLE